MKVAHASLLLAFLASATESHPIETCSQQSDCIAITSEKMSGDTPLTGSACVGDADCIYKICIKDDRTNCVKGGTESWSHICDGSGSDDCPRGDGTNLWTGETEVSGTFGWENCQYVPAGETAYFLMKDGDGCGASPPSEEFTFDNGITATCSPSKDGVTRFDSQTCTGNGEGVECIWQVTAPSCSQTEEIIPYACPEVVLDFNDLPEGGFLYDEWWNTKGVKVTAAGGYTPYPKTGCTSSELGCYCDNYDPGSPQACGAWQPYQSAGAARVFNTGKPRGFSDGALAQFNNPMCNPSNSGDGDADLGSPSGYCSYLPDDHADYLSRENGPGDQSMADTLGQYPNCPKEKIGNVLIIQEGKKTCPDDVGGGGTISFEFNTAIVGTEGVTFLMGGFIDIDDGSTHPSIKFTKVGESNPDPSLTKTTSPTGGNGLFDLAFDVAPSQIEKLEISYPGSGCIREIRYIPSECPGAAIPTPSPVERVTMSPVEPVLETFVTLPPVEQIGSCPFSPNVNIEKTVHIGDIATCSTGQELEYGFQGTVVTYCYEVTNTGDGVMSIGVTDEGVGTNGSCDLAAGETCWIRELSSITTTLNSDGVATGMANGCPQVTDADAAGVSLLPDLQPCVY